jgi:signal transduction histidine kinase
MVQPTDIGREPYKIVLVEANEPDAQRVTRILVQHARPRFTVELAESFADSNRAISSLVPDLVLLDLNLPDGQGIELLHRVRAAHLLVPIVVINTLTEQDIGRAALSEGAQNYWTKSALDGEQLIHMIESAISHDQRLRRDRSGTERSARDDRIGSVGRMTLGLVHDFKNILMVIQGNAALLQHPPDRSLPTTARLSAIDLAVQEGVRVCRQLLAFCKGNPYEVATLDLDVVVAELLPLLERAAGSEIRVDHRRSVEPVYVCADRAQLTQVVMNLVLNANESLGDSGHIVIETRSVGRDAAEAEPDISLRNREYGELIVSDDGCGMDASTQAHIFDEFFTTKEHGTGLGLSIVCGAIRDAGGKLAVDSAVGVGSRFRVYLPTSSLAAAVEAVPSVDDVFAPILSPEVSVHTP